MKRKIYTISLLLSFLLVLSHQVISHHHHHESLANDFTANHEKVDMHKHEHNDKHHHHDSNEESGNEKASDRDHNNPFPFHHHVAVTNDFDCTRANLQESNISNHSIKIITVLCLFHREHPEPPKITNYSYKEPPFIINSLFEPVAIALRGPPSIV